MKRILTAALIGAALTTTGCATILRGTKTDFVVDSMPSGAHVQLSSGESCDATPCTFHRSRKEAFTVTVTSPGYLPSVTTITHHWSRRGTTTGVVGNAILGGGIGIGVDAATGANQDLFPNPLMVELRPDPGTAPAQPAN